jgi:hypothetical protein
MEIVAASSDPVISLPLTLATGASFAREHDATAEAAANIAIIKRILIWFLFIAG